MVSVIVAAYNAAEWLDAAVGSVLAQTMADWELILVDDGSTDSTPAICERYEASDSRVRVLHRPNGGISAARNSGLDAAAGEWISFLDADDVLAPGALQAMVDAAVGNDADAAGSDMLLFAGVGPEWPCGAETGGVRVYERRDAVEHVLYQSPGMHSSVCGRVFRKELWTGLRFREGRRYEDLDIFYRVVAECRRYAYVKECLYGYRQHEASFMHRFTDDRLDALDVTKDMEEWGAANGPDMLRAARDRRLSANFNMFLLSEGAWRRGECTRLEAREIQRGCFALIKRLRSETLTNPKTRLKNKLGALVSYMGPGVLRRLYRLL